MSKNPEEQNPSVTPVSARRRIALLRYMAVLFAAAFLLVLFSFLVQMRNNRNTISELNQNNSNALSNAEALQTMNQLLLEQNAELQDQIDDLTARLDAAEDAVDDTGALQTRLDATQAELDEAAAEAAALHGEVDALTEQLNDTQAALALSSALSDGVAAYYAGTIPAVCESLQVVDALRTNGAAMDDNQQTLYNLLQTAVTAGTAESGN